MGSRSSLNALLGTDVLDANDEVGEKNKTKFGVNGGAGLEFGVGPAAIFLESRWVNVFANRKQDLTFDEFFGDRSKHIRWVPLVLGVSFR
jgi:hypothetical protein